MRIAFFEIEEWEKPRVRGKFGEDVYLDEKKVDEDELSKENDFEIISIFVDSRITEKVLAHFPNLKFIATRSTGFDHIDLAACKKRNISVSYVPGYGDNTVAEFTFGLILNLTRKIYHGIDQIKETGSFSFEGLRGTDLKGKTIGIIGTGRIGKEALKIAKGFGMKVIASDPYPDEKFAKEENFEYVSLEKLLSSSDIITVHCPYNEKTRHLINKENIRLIKKGAYLINTARGGIVETDALAGALEEGILAGAGLDVLEEEGETKEEMEFLRRGKFKEDELKTMLQNHMLMRMPNVLITPHNAFNSREALERILGTTLENIEGFLSGGPVNLVP
ncbi:MAG: D-isomer specific 2-hydroxyacid dehydrogenase NAD-binding protein [Candidatus Jorgensenbacteria bacterium GW2011_GWA1_48_13]|uniref:D-isomer specific 2-hydroxyacid dehydrogenase NAD-binding protein n=1 Tax=Candidatus Jorgensenbacteria bacterium GW2011_GWB1_50_10 TaxID=1618665 RepID=A0A0G1W9G9_9BACT|nr:MAG: D-isomer specific 2-hydroxyacid dehydrogenase NAD-binding protein [Candidatus Jorgensenbacteria bacterium GW2011_GWA1_48_13]KKW15418.1 MAG: D-isomer specific 2-hydroxyacid dehydrogenase NAD-binding protein [Candidatus Jorgensenbacteria bacterium GW2011_GWB1_50_10]